ncbi:MAG TPA: STM3941 family protein [Thermoanaerobaculia bacterium]
MQSITFERSRLKTAATSLGGAAFALLGFFLAQNGDDFYERAIGWLCVLFFGAVAVASFPHIFRAGRVFSIDEQNIHDHARKLDIAWTEVDDVRVVHAGGISFLALRFHDRDSVLRRVSRLRRAMATMNDRQGWGHWSFSFTSVTPDINAALDFIRNNVPSVRLRSRV